jgi:hypothetical protein
LTKIIEELKMAGDNSSTLLLLNSTMATRRVEETTSPAEGKTTA